MSHGLFFVIDGVDGTGKATQTAKLVERLGQAGHQVETISFPQYQHPSAGSVERYLGGAYGEQVNAYQASVLFAVDRYDASFRIREALKSGKVVVADRYVASNMGHQGGKIANEKERHTYFAWNDDFEYRLMNLPRPTLTIILDLPAEQSQALARASAQSKTKVANDIHEHNLPHLQSARRVYQEIAQQFPGFFLLSCLNAQGAMLSREEIHEAIWQQITPLLIPPSAPLTNPWARLTVHDHYAV